jgi:hypothetical protein
MRVMDIRQKLRQLLALILGKKKTNQISVPPKHEMVEAEMSKKPEIDLGLICGVVALVLTVAAIFEPVRSWYFIVPVLLFTAAMVIVTVWKCFRLPPFSQRSKSYSALVAIGVLVVFTGYGWRIRPITSYDPARLRQMSNEELKEIEKKLADEMRDYQSAYDKKDSELFSKLRPNSPQTLAQITQLGNEFRGGFYQNYLGRALAVRDEFLWRLGKTPEQADKDVLAELPPILRMMQGPVGLSRAFGGVLAGGHPVSDAGEFLDALARRLH